MDTNIKVFPRFQPFKVIIYIVCIVLAALSLFPFIIMIVNSTRSTPEIQGTAVSLVPSSYLARNYTILVSKDMFDPIRGFINSIIISSGATLCSVYFSTLTAYAIVVYEWKARRGFFTFIMAIMMIPGVVVSIGFYKMVYAVGLSNNFLPLIIPGIAAPAMVFFMRQYMIPALPLEIIQSARIDGAGEFYTFNKIALPIMKPAIATQGIMAFVGNWNNLFMPLIILTQKHMYTMPIMVSLLKGDIYKVEYGSVYLGLTLTVLPLFVVYFLLSKYIIAGIAVGSVKG